MSIMQRGVTALSGHVPKVISPKAHAIADYVTLGGFVLMAALFWRRNKRAAVASLICAGSEATNTLLTDFPGGVTDVISFPTHGKIDMGLVAAASSLPDSMGFADEPAAEYFRVMGLNVTAVAAMTDFAQPLRRSTRLRKTA